MERGALGPVVQNLLVAVLTPMVRAPATNEAEIFRARKGLRGGDTTDEKLGHDERVHRYRLHHYRVLSTPKPADFPVQS